MGKNEFHHNVEVDTVEASAYRVSRDEMVQAVHEMKTGKAPTPSAVSLELTVARRKSWNSI